MFPSNVRKINTATTLISAIASLSSLSVLLPLLPVKHIQLLSNKSNLNKIIFTISIGVTPIITSTIYLVVDIVKHHFEICLMFWILHCGCV